jgi:hypothetical protein
MSNSSETDFDLELHFLPAWAQKPPQENRYADYRGEPDREGPRERRGDRGPRERRRDEGGPRRPRPGGQDRDRFKAGKGPHRGKGDDRRRGPQEERPSAPPAPLPEVQVSLVPDDKGVDSLARQIKMTGRAYPLFDIAQMILQKPERYSVTLTTKKKPDGSVAEPLFLCALDDTPWLSEDDAVRWVMEKHFETFYQPEKIKIEGPKGVYTFVAQCGLSGEILGPPNYHDYQNKLRKLHAERFSRMPFEAYKARVKIVKDEETIKKWVEDQSWKTEYIALNVPEPVRLASREEVEKHFRETHLANIIKQVDTCRLTGTTSRQVRSNGLNRLIRQSWEEQRRFPLQIATVLSQQFAALGLQFFKVNKTVTHVAVARPHFLDMDATPVSEGVRKIVHFINEHPKTTRRELLQALAPAPAPLPSAEPQPAPTAEAAASGQPIPEPTPEQTAVISDLHWLIHQGHVIEFANGKLDTAKKPAPKPPKPEKTPAAQPPDATIPAPGDPGSVSPGVTAPGEAGSEIGTPVAAPTEPGAAQHTSPAEPGEVEQQAATAPSVATEHQTVPAES